jgi:outer membrane immunogenic protein
MILGKLIRTSVAAFGALAAASVTQANAADVYSGGGGYKDTPAPPCCSFAGFYIGGNMGIAWSEIERNGGTFNDGWKDGYGVWHANSVNFNGDKLKSTNGFGGGQIGYNYQNNCCWLFGIEVDLGALALNNNIHRFIPMNDRMVNGVSFDGNKDNDAFFAGDVTARVGYTFGNSLVYVKGGFAFIDANDQLRETIFWRNSSWHPSPTGNLSDTFGNNNGDNWLTGWTVGAGYEWKPCCQSSWSIKVEYLHYDFSNNNNDCCNDWFTQKYPGVINNRLRNDHDLTADTIKVGFNYFWNPPVAPLK